MEPIETLSWGLKIRKLSSVRHRNLLLRLAHGDLYTNERLNRFGLRGDPDCEKCGQIDTLKHRILECTYSLEIWRELERVTGQKILNPLLEIEPILGMHKDLGLEIITVIAETLQIISYKNPNLPPGRTIKIVLDRLKRREKGEVKIFIEEALAKI
jgi:hypothetical protein